MTLRTSVSTLKVNVKVYTVLQPFVGEEEVTKAYWKGDGANIKVTEVLKQMYYRFPRMSQIEAVKDPVSFEFLGFLI